MSTSRIKTFSIGFREQEFDELPYARLVAKRFGTDHHELVLEPDVVDLLDHLAWDLDEPFGDSSAIPTYMPPTITDTQPTFMFTRSCWLVPEVLRYRRPFPRRSQGCSIICSGSRDRTERARCTETMTAAGY